MKKGYIIDNFGLAVLSFIVQRVFRINPKCRYLVNYTSRIIMPHNLEIGEGVERSLFLSNNLYIQAGNPVKIGSRTLIAPNVSIVSSNRKKTNIEDHEFSDTASISIGERCWIGVGAVILPGVNLGNDVIVGANAVVTKSFPDNAIVVGNPAQQIESREQ